MESLVLNLMAIPVSIVPSIRAVTLVMSQKAVVLESYPDTFIRSASFSMQIPSVIQCTRSNYNPKIYINKLPFTRKNLYIRDHGCCMYCGKKVSLSGMSFDHVIPRHLGGRTNWENIVLSCFKCNSKKGDKLPNKFKIPLRNPYAPKLSHAAPKQLVSKLASEIIEKTWQDYIYWEIILDED